MSHNDTASSGGTARQTTTADLSRSTVSDTTTTAIEIPIAHQGELRGMMSALTSYHSQIDDSDDDAELRRAACIKAWYAIRKVNKTLQDESDVPDSLALVLDVEGNEQIKTLYRAFGMKAEEYTDKTSVYFNRRYNGCQKAMVQFHEARTQYAEATTDAQTDKQPEVSG